MVVVFDNIVITNRGALGSEESDEPSIKNQFLVPKKPPLFVVITGLVIYSRFSLQDEDRPTRSYNFQTKRGQSTKLMPLSSSTMIFFNYKIIQQLSNVFASKMHEATKGISLLFKASLFSN